MGLCTAVFCNCGSSMELFEYLNQLYDSDDLHDYKYGKIYPETAELSAQDKERLELILEIIRMNENYGEKENVFQQYHRDRLPDWKSIFSVEAYVCLRITR